MNFTKIKNAYLERIEQTFSRYSLSNNFLQKHEYFKMVLIANNDEWYINKYLIEYF